MRPKACHSAVRSDESLGMTRRRMSDDGTKDQKVNKEIP